jgi:hypothetical protein
MTPVLSGARKFWTSTLSSATGKSQTRKTLTPALKIMYGRWNAAQNRFFSVKTYRQSNGHFAVTKAHGLTLVSRLVQIPNRRSRDG